MTAANLDWHKELESVVAMMFAGTREVENAPESTRASMAKIVGAGLVAGIRSAVHNGTLPTDMRSQLSAWGKTVTAEQPSGSLEGLSARQIIRGLSWWVQNQELAITSTLPGRLCYVIGMERGIGGLGKLHLGCYVEAGLALEELAVVDPYFVVTGPAVNAFFETTYEKNTSREDLCVPTILDAIARMLSPAWVARPCTQQVKFDTPAAHLR
jgi:hypothetical protein